MDYLSIFIALGTLTGTFIGLWQLHKRWVISELRQHFWPALLLKIAGGWSLGWLYTHFYPYGDTWAMYADSLMLVECLGFGKDYFRYIFSIYEAPDELLGSTQAVGHKALWMSLITGIVGWFAAKNYWLISLYYSVFSFLGVWAMIQVFRRYLAVPIWILSLGWLYWPSLLFWGSGLLKESLMMGSIGWLVALTLYFHLGENGHLKLKTAGGIWGLCCAYLLLQVKYYYFAPLLICLGGLWGLWMARGIWQQYKIATSISLALLMAGLVFMGQQIYPALQFNQFPEQIIENQQHIYGISSTHSSLIIYEGIEATWGSLISFLPQAFLEGSFRPFIWEDGHWLKKFAALEGIVLTLALLMVIWQIVQNGWPKLLSTYAWLLIGFGCLYIAITGCLLPMAAPNIGAMMRYRIGYWPFMLMLILLMGHKKRAGR